VQGIALTFEVWRLQKQVLRFAQDDKLFDKTTILDEAKNR
jgi:hypothetical protein